LAEFREKGKPSFYGEGGWVEGGWVDGAALGMAGGDLAEGGLPIFSSSSLRIAIR
jgi:hypothetical protein